jgi:hypothetical protein
MGIYWINLAQYKGKWQHLVNTVMNIWVPKSVVIFLTSQGIISFSVTNVVCVVS